MGAYLIGVGENPPTEVPQVSTVVQVPVNIFTGTLQGKLIYLNNFKTDILADATDESRLDFEDIIYEKGELINPKEFSHENWTQWEDSIYI